MTETQTMIEAALRHQRSGEHREAAMFYRELLRTEPENAEIHNNLGIASRALGQLEFAINCYRRAVQLRPDFAAAYNNLGNALWEQGTLEAALVSLSQAVRLQPRTDTTWCTIGLILRQLGQFEEAVKAFRQAIALNPSFAEAHNGLGTVLQDQGHIPRAVESYAAAIKLKGDFASAHVNLGNALSALHRFDESCLHYRRALEITPDYNTATNNLLMVMQYAPDFDANELFAAHCRWGEELERKVTESHQFQNPLVEERPLRVGYVSPDFRRHAVASFIEPILSSHDPASIETFCYAEVDRPDDVTMRLQASVANWRSTVGVSDMEVVKMIHRDRIDILVDLAGHTSGNRLGVFARKAAPIQASYLGYGNTTGLSNVDYWLTDEIANPPGEQNYYTEELIRLKRGFLCFASPSAPPVGPLLAIERGYLTFGSFNRRIKINSEVVRLWSRILRALPTARLLLKDRAFADEEMRSLTLRDFSENGVEPQRIDLLPRSASAQEHLQLYNRVDIALDPFPYNGSTTTCEALWMGVPVLTLRGNCYVSRMTSSLLTRVGLPEFITESADEYVSRAVQLAGQTEQLNRLRAELRPRMSTSPLCDATGYTRELESVYRTMWQRWCTAAR